MRISPLAILNQTTTISMHIPSLVKIHRNKNIDGWQTDSHMNVQRETITPCHRSVAGYEKNYNLGYILIKLCDKIVF